MQTIEERKKEACETAKVWKLNAERNEKMYDYKKAGLSKNALKVLGRIEDGHYYKPYQPDTPKCIQELVDAGLVKLTGRVTVVELAYVPSTNYIPYVNEKFL